MIWHDAPGFYLYENTPLKKEFAMSIVSKYLDIVLDLLESIKQERVAIDEAAKLIADRIEEDGLVYIGNGGAHSGIGLEELFYRAGGLACMSPMMDEGVYLTNGAVRTTIVERIPGYGQTVVDIYGVEKGDVVIITTSVGITSMAIDEALECKERGAKVIAITSTSFAENTPPGHPSRHPSNKNLHELADVFVDCHVPYGDAVLQLDGLQQKFAPCSTIALTFVANAIVARVVQLLHERGIEPPIWKSPHTPGGDAVNSRYIERYATRIKHLV
jgi:uncharacterized phosphosugar-binding protein